MKWYVEITTEKGKFQLPLDGWYRTKKEAMRIASLAGKVKENLQVEVKQK